MRIRSDTFPDTPRPIRAATLLMAVTSEDGAATQPPLARIVPLTIPGSADSM